MKNIRKRADGRFEARIQRNNKRISLYAATEKQCYKKLKSAQKSKALTQTNENCKISFYDYINYWYKTFKEPFIKEDTKESIFYTIKRIKQCFPNKPLSYYTLEVVQPILNTYKKSRSKELMVTYLKAMFETAVELQYLTRNPFKLIIKETKLNNIRQALSLQDQTNLLKIIRDTQIEPHIIFFLITGIRKGEYDTINWGTDIDSEQNTLKIKCEKKRGDVAEYRNIDLSQKAIDFIKNNLDKLRNTKSQTIYKNLKISIKDTDLKISLHNLRHTFTTNYACLGAPMKLVSEWLGHTKIELTQNIYNHIDRTLSKEALIKLYNNLYKEF